MVINRMRYGRTNKIRSLPKVMVNLVRRERISFVSFNHSCSYGNDFIFVSEKVSSLVLSYITNFSDVSVFMVKRAFADL